MAKFQLKYHQLFALVSAAVLSFSALCSGESLPADPHARVQDAAEAPVYAGNYPGTMSQPVPILNSQELYKSRGSVMPLYVNTPFDSAVVNKKLGEALLTAAEKAGSMAKSVGQTINEYMKEKQLQKAQEELVQRFYAYMNLYLDGYRLTPDARRRIMAKVEEIYIEDGATDKYHLDTIQFREMASVVRKVHGDVMLESVRNGDVTTYYISGRPQTRWKLRDGEPHGAVVSYYENGEILYIDIYEQGKKVSRKKYTEDGKLEFEQDYSYELEEMPGAESGSSLMPGPAAAENASGHSSAQVPQQPPPAPDSLASAAPLYPEAE